MEVLPSESTGVSGSSGQFQSDNWHSVVVIYVVGVGAEVSEPGTRVGFPIRRVVGGDA